MRERERERPTHTNMLTCSGSGVLSTNDCVIGLSGLLAAPQLQLTCKGQAGVNKGSRPFHKTGGAKRMGFYFFAEWSGGCAEERRTGDGMRCDRRASQTLLASL